MKGSSRPRTLEQVDAGLATSTERLKILHEIDAAIIGAEAPVAIAEAVLRPLRDLLGVLLGATLPAG